MEDADSDSGFDSDGDWYHAGRDIVHGLRTNSHAVGPTEHTEDGSCAEKRKREAPRWGCLFFVVKDTMTGDRSLSHFSQLSQRAWHRVT